MKLIHPYFEIEDFDASIVLKKIEKAGRTCYKSEEKITDDSSFKFIKNIIERGHESVLEHEKVTVRVICDRGVSHEIVRHRIASYSQESTRYCDYAGGHITFILPEWVEIDPGEYKALPSLQTTDASNRWLFAMWNSEQSYRALRDKGWQPQAARSVLPNSLKTEIVMTMNLREWRHFFKLRTNNAAHPQMRQIAIPLLRSFQRLILIVFDDILI